MEDIIRGFGSGSGRLRAAVGCITWAQNEFNGIGHAVLAVLLEVAC